VLVDGQGRTLYMFPPDAGSQVTCTGPCAGTWPPLVIQDGHGATAGSGVIAADLGTLADPNTGARIVTYAGYPLYRYAGDVTAGTANGQALFLNGGPWYAVRANGQSVTVNPAARR
jgi:predicted lipoprotein with Yx(FWY)xxD motif